VVVFRNGHVLKQVNKQPPVAGAEGPNPRSTEWRQASAGYHACRPPSRVEDKLSPARCPEKQPQLQPNETEGRTEGGRRFQEHYI
jgi:hypothetical protein